MDLNTQACRDGAAPLGGDAHCGPNHGANPALGGVYGVLSAIWLWLGMISLDVLGGVLGWLVISEVSHPTWDASPVNRNARQRRARWSGRAVPAALNLEPFYAIGPNVSPTQFLERLCRLSGQGRVYVYEMVYWSHRLSREAFMALFSRGDFRMPDGLCDAHITPD